MGHDPKERRERYGAQTEALVERQRLYDLDGVRDGHILQIAVAEGDGAYPLDGPREDHGPQLMADAKLPRTAFQDGLTEIRGKRI